MYERTSASMKPWILTALDMKKQLLNSEIPQTREPTGNGEHADQGKKQNKQTQNKTRKEDEENSHKSFWNGGNSRKKSIDFQDYNYGWLTKEYICFIK